MNPELSQTLTIELNTQGRNTIPIIYPENIITIHGKNGVGKSMAATLLEIASGNYTFENKDRFQKLANIIDSCDIQFKNNSNLLYEVNLKPHLCKFDENLNRINPFSLGKFYNLEKERKKEIDLDEFRKNINIRTIRGNESLHQQIIFFKDLLVAKINQKLKKLEQIIEFLEKYQEWLKENAKEELIDNYYNLQEKYKDQLSRMTNLQNSIRNREETLGILKRKLDLLPKLIFISTNNIEDLNENKKKEEIRIQVTQREIDSKYRELSIIEQKLDEIKNQFDEKTKKDLEKIKKLRTKEKRLKEQLNSESKLKLVNLGEEKIKIEIENSIKSNQEEIKRFKVSIEEINKENERIIEINNFLTQLRDICSKASSCDFGKEKLIKVKIGGKNDILLSFEQLFEILHKNNLTFKQDKDLIEVQNKVREYNENIKKNRKILEILTEYATVQGGILQLEKRINQKGSNLDSFVALDTKMINLENKQKDQKNIIENLGKDLLDSKNKMGVFEKLIEDVKEIPSQTSLINKLKKYGIIINQTEAIEERCNKEISKVDKEIKESSNELILDKQREKETKKNIEKSKNDLDPILQNIRKAAEQFKYTQVGEFLDYFKAHNNKLKKYLDSTNNLHTRLNILQNDIIKVLEGVKPKNNAHLKIINTHFDDIFKKIYGRPEFFEYVFKDYSKIKRFEIADKTIIFETPGGLEETRDLEEFSSGEKTYAYCRSIISMTANIAKYNIVILDESYALLDHEHSQNLYQFQEQMVQQKGITKFINILPLKDDLHGLTAIVEKSLEEEKKKGISSNIKDLESQLEILQTFKNEVSTRGYYQEIHFPKERRRELNKNFGGIQNFNSSVSPTDFSDEELAFSFILDGSNIARDNPNSKNASIRDVVKCKKKLQKLGVPEKNILIIFGAGLRHHIPDRDKHLYETLLKERTINQAPAERDDDWFIIQYALDHNSYIITNDRYIEYRQKSRTHERFIKSNSIRYSVIGNDIIFEEGFRDKLKTIISKVKNNQ